MTVRLAAARSRAMSSPVSRALTRRPVEQVANDDPLAVENAELLAAALREFAVHGIGAAERISQQARLALQSGDVASFVHYRDICHMLDRRLARTLDADLAAATGSGTGFSAR